MKIKFFVTPVYPYGNDHYYHEMIAVAEGFRELGHVVVGNCNYWFEPESNSYLLKEDMGIDYDIAIYDYRYVTSFAHLLFREGYPNFEKNKKHVLIDRNDWISPIWHNNHHYNKFDAIFAGNLYTNERYAKNIYPWAIGLTNRIISYIDKTYDVSKEAHTIIGHNYRVTHNMRDYVLEGLKNSIKSFEIKECYTVAEKQNWSSVDEHYSKYSINRHFPEYYKMLNETAMFMTTGGYYEFKPLLYQPYTLVDKFKRKPYYMLYKYLLKKKKDITPAVFIFQYDNFRFWEVLYSLSCPINIDYESWNFKLPAMPISGIHYLGIKNFNFIEFENRLKQLSPSQIKSIGEAGRKWVCENYSPRAQAQRILKTLKF